MEQDAGDFETFHPQSLVGTLPEGKSSESSGSFLEGPEESREPHELKESEEPKAEETKADKLASLVTKVDPAAALFAQPEKEEHEWIATTEGDDD